MKDQIEKLAAHFGIFPNLNEEDILEIILQRLDKVPYIPYPVSFHTVDIALYRFNSQNKLELLLGRKPDRDVWQFVGGFLDPKNTAENAAEREVEEETTLSVIPITYENYRGSFFINDRRYIHSCHKVTTSFFIQEVHTGEAVASDDIAEVKWFDYSDLKLSYKDVILDSHQQLFEQFKKTVTKIKHEPSWNY